MIIYLGKKSSFEEMIKDLRDIRNVDPDKQLSDEFLIQEAYNLEEWEYPENV